MDGLFGLSLCSDPKIRDTVLLLKFFTNLSVPASCIEPVNCSDPEVTVEFVHLPNNVSEQCEKVENIAFRIVYPVLLILAIFGNVINLIVYSMPFFKGSKAVHLLRARSAVNLGYILSLLVLAIHEWLKYGRKVTFPKYEHFYGTYYIYVQTVTNILGNLNSWYTLLITMEIAICILKPVVYKQSITHHNIVCTIAICLVLSSLINGLIPVTRTIKLTTLPTQPDSLKQCTQFYAPHLRPGALMLELDKVYYWIEVMLVTSIPILLMLCCAVLITCRLRSLSVANMPRMTGRRKCVLRITLSTAFLHLFCTAPSLIIMSIAAINGSSGRGVSPALCLSRVLANFLNLFNSTLPFFIYIVCSNQFQRMSLSLFGFSTQRNAPNCQRYTRPSFSTHTINGHGVRCTTVDSRMDHTHAEERRRVQSLAGFNNNTHHTTGSERGGSADKTPTRRQRRGYFAKRNLSAEVVSLKSNEENMNMPEETKETLIHKETLL